MGNEAKCVARIAGKRHEGKALLETSELIFRGAECRVKIAFAEVRGVTAADGELHVKTSQGEAVFAIGSAADKWREKILHPKPRVEKLGVKQGIRIALLGEVEAAFAKELKSSKAEIVNPSADSEAHLVFLGLGASDGISSVAKAAKKIRGSAALWVVYPKGKREVTELDVIAAGRKAGLKDVKVVGFSATHTALKFVLPIDKR